MMLKIPYLMSFALLLGLPLQSHAADSTTVAAKGGAVGLKLVAPPGTFTDPASPLLCKTSPDYITIEPFTAYNYEVYAKQDDGTWKLKVEPFPADNSAINKLLPNLETAIVETSHDIDAGLQPIFGAKLHRKVITMDFVKFRSEPVRDGTTKTVLAYARVGIGMRVVVDVITDEVNIGGSLMALAASVRNKRSSGKIMAFSIGMDAPDLNVVMPAMDADITDQSIQKVIEAIGVIKIKFRDSNTTITPQYLARIECRPEPSPKQAASQ